MAQTLTVNGAVTLTIASIVPSALVNAAGTMELPLSVECQITGSTFAAKMETWRQLSELAWYSRHAGGVYLSFGNLTVVNGLYAMSVESGWPRTGLPTVRLRLTRLGGEPLGGNVVQRVRAVSSLQSNNYNITITPRIAIPVGAQSVDVGASPRTTKDGAVNVHASAPTYTFAGADYNKGECKVFDTRGDGTEANWQRVWSPDHTFSDPSHLVIENGLLRLTGVTGGNNGSHRYWVWTGSAYTEITASATGDATHMGTGPVTANYIRLLIEELTPWRVKVSLTTIHSSGPQFLTKTITLERGHPLARVALSAPSVTTFQLGIKSGRWVFTKGAPLSGGVMQRPAYDDQEEAGNPVLNAPEGNWVCSFTTKSATTGTLAIGAWASNALVEYAIDNGGFVVEATSATSLVVYLGGVKYDTSSAQLEAEAGTLTGTAALVATIAGASGSGNDQVSLPAVSDRVDITTNLASIGGSTVLMLFRIAKDAAGNSSDELTLYIRNTTASTDLAFESRNATHFAAASTWYWEAVVGTGWNGTDALAARVIRTGSGLAIGMYVDEVIAVAIAGSTTLMQVDAMAAEALTETRALPVHHRHNS